MSLRIPGCYRKLARDIINLHDAVLNNPKQISQQTINFTAKERLGHHVRVKPVRDMPVLCGRL